MAEEAESIDFAGFYTATATRVVGYLYVVLGSVAEAEDAAQEAYTRAWLRWPKVRGYDDPEAWVRTVGFRVAMSSWRKTRNRLSAQRSSGAGASGVHVPEMSPDRLVVVAALRRLPAEQRRVLVLFHLLGLTIAEIAEEIGAPAGTVKARLSRGRKALAPYVSEFADDEDAPPGAAAPGESSASAAAAASARSAKSAEPAEPGQPGQPAASAEPSRPHPNPPSSGEPSPRFVKKGMVSGA